jgi:DNA-binding MarR family transcriptional regulator
MNVDPGCSAPMNFSGADETATATWRAYVSTLHAYRRLMARSIATHEVSPAQSMALKEIGHNDGITQRDLAERLRISRPTLTVMLQKMEKAALVERLADVSDQRFTHLHLTAEGRALHERMHGVMGKMVSEVIGPLSETDRAELTRLLGLVHDNINTALETTNATDKEAAE